MPSIEEIIYMLDRSEYNRIKKAAGRNDIIDYINIDYIPTIGKELLNMGVKIALIKCGKLGLYMKTADERLLKKIGKARPKNLVAWADKEMFSSVYKVDEVRSTNGAGDTTIGGFLAALLKDADAIMALQLACAAGAISVQSSSATDGILPYDVIQKQIATGWDKSPVDYTGNYWQYDERHQIMIPRSDQLRTTRKNNGFGQ